jgi:rare lipoprotein A
MATPDAEVRNDPLIARANKEYSVFGKTYRPITDPDQPFVQRGLGTWYGKKFHGQRTSSGELYDMYKMTAAHPTLPIPSYARVTNLDNGNQVVVRVNDRGPFHSTRIIDVSYTAALKLGLLDKGSHELEVVRILPAEAQRMMANGGKEGGQGREKSAPAVVLRPQAPAPAPQREPAQAAALLYPPPPAGGAAQATAQAAPAAAASAPAIAPAVAKAATVGTPAASAASEASTLPAAYAVPGAATAATASGTPAAPAASPAGAVMLAGGAHAPAGGAIAPAGAAKGGYYLQLGAYSKPENAEAARAKVAMESGLAGLEVVPSGSVLRLYGGPYATRQEAEQAIQSLPASLGLKPLVIQR